MNANKETQKQTCGLCILVLLLLFLILKFVLMWAHLNLFRMIISLNISITIIVTCMKREHDA